MNDPRAPAATPAATGPRARYHHGALREALVTAGVALAREGGPAAVVLREAARRSGVSPTAAYRHFADHAALIEAVKQAGLGLLGEAMAAGLPAGPPTTDPGSAARDRVRGLLLAYIDFAMTEPGLFRLAFDRPDATRPPSTGSWEAVSFQLLATALDELVTAGVMHPGQRPDAELAFWAAAHGLAMLLVGGPPAAMHPAARAAAIDRTLALLLAGAATAPIPLPGRDAGQ